MRKTLADETSSASVAKEAACRSQFFDFDH
jgi:hypothetical protein